MTIQLNPYLNFRDNTREAMEFYRDVFGGELTISTFGEMQASEDPSEDQKVMHAMLMAPNGITFMASDTPNNMDFQVGTNFSMSLSGDEGDQLRAYFEKLAAGGEITMPLDMAPWGDTFGMCMDRFGVNWLVNIAAPAS